MKKLSILFASLLVAAMLVTSCDKDEKSEGVNDLGKATISGKVWMDYEDQSNNPNGSVNYDSEYAPEGIQLIATIDAADLAQDVSTTPSTAKKTYYTTVGADGNYSFTIDCGAKSVTVEISGEEKMQPYSTWGVNSVSGNPEYQTDNRTSWGFAPISVNVVNKQHQVVDINYVKTGILEDI